MAPPALPGSPAVMTEKDVGVTPVVVPVQKRHRDAAPFIAGAIAAVTSSVAVYPIDTIKTRIQAGSSVASAIKDIGSWTSAFASAPSSAVRLQAREAVGGALADVLSPLPLQITAGLAGAIAATFVVAPRELVRKRLQTGMNKNVVQEVASIVRSGGPLKLFQGLGITLWRECPFFVANFITFDAISNSIKTVKKRKPSNVELLLAGGVAGAVAAAVSTPFDLIHTLQMTGQGALAVAAGVRDMYGMQGLWRGITPRILSVAPLHAAWWFVYENMLHTLRKDSQEESA
eukprot:jgi/Chlat1/286/Chrsp1S03170